MKIWCSPHDKCVPAFLDPSSMTYSLVMYSANAWYVLRLMSTSSGRSWNGTGNVLRAIGVLMRKRSKMRNVFCFDCRHESLPPPAAMSAGVWVLNLPI